MAGATLRHCQPRGIMDAAARDAQLYPRARKRTHALREAQIKQGTCKPCVRWALVSPWSPGASRPACLPGPAPDPLDATRARRAYSSKVSPSYAAREFGKIAFARFSLSRTAVVVLHRVVVKEDELLHVRRPQPARAASSNVLWPQPIFGPPRPTCRRTPRACTARRR